MKSLVQVPIVSTPTQNISFEKWAHSHIEDFLLAIDCSDFTRKQYRDRLKQFLAWLGKVSEDSVRRETILAYRKSMKDQKFQPTTIGAYLVAVRQFFQWLEIHRLYPDVTKGIKGAKRGRGFRRDALTIPQIHRLLDSIDRSDSKGRRDFALINLLIRTGLRSIEVARCVVGNIRPVNSDAIGLWVQGKGHEEADEFVILTEDCISPIMAYLSDRGSLKQDDPLFASLSDGSYSSSLSTRTIRRVVKERLRAIGINSPRLTSHSLRHTAVSLSLEGGASLQEAQKLARHADISTTTIYAHNIDVSKGIGARSIEKVLKR